MPDAYCSNKSKGWFHKRGATPHLLQRSLTCYPRMHQNKDKILELGQCFFYLCKWSRSLVRKLHWPRSSLSTYFHLLTYRLFQKCRVEQWQSRPRLSQFQRHILWFNSELQPKTGSPKTLTKRFRLWLLSRLTSVWFKHTVVRLSCESKADQPLCHCRYVTAAGIQTLNYY